MFEGHGDVYDDDLVSDQGEMSDLEEYAEELDLGKDVMAPRAAALGVPTRYSGEVVMKEREEV